MRRERSPFRRSHLPRGFVTRLMVIVIGLTMLLIAASLFFVSSPEETSSEQSARDSRGRLVLTVAYSSEKAALFERLVKAFNDLNPRYTIRATKLEMDEMMAQAPEGKFTAISPDSAVWLAPLDHTWLAEDSSRANLVGSLSRYALSPVVVAMWQSQAQKLGYPGKSIGWNDLVVQATSEQGLRWSHSSTTTAAGLLTTTAEFYAASGKTNRLTEEDLANPAVQEYVRQVERTVQRYGGESEDRLVERLVQGERTLDAFVGQEATVIRFNRLSHGEKLVAIYPREGTLWMDHPLALLEGPWLTPDHRRGFQEMADFFRSAPMQKIVLQEGYRPADLGISLDDPESQITATNGVDPSQPQTMLQMPPYSVLERIRSVWALLKRPANIYLVADVSGSMEGEKLDKAKEAMLSFIRQVVSESDRLALASFSSAVYEDVALAPIAENRQQLTDAVSRLEPRSNTALYDAILYAAQRLSEQRDPERINAVLVMTDGQENASHYVRSGDSSALLEALRALREETGVPVLVFSVGYGDDANLEELRTISESTQAQAYQGNPQTIRKLYQLLSAYFN